MTPTKERVYRAQWVSVTDRLPQIGQDVLAWCGWHITASYKHPLARKPACAWHTEDRTNPIFHVTHWMPLPASPYAAAASAKKRRRK